LEARFEENDMHAQIIRENLKKLNI
jgi:hypothetical protein